MAPKEVFVRSTKLGLVAVAVVCSVACGFSSGAAGPVVNDQYGIDLGAATQARVDIDMSAGDLNVQSGAKKLFEGDFAYNMPALKPRVDYAVSGSTGTLKVSQGSASGNVENRWRLRLDEKTPIDLTITLGAGDSELVLGRLNLRSLTIRLGAGDLKLDLRGTPAASYSVKVQAGAGDATIQLPASVGISASTTGLIGDSNFSGLEKRGDEWVNPSAEGAAVTVSLQVQHAIGDLRISAE
jgi:hypothetical protein